MDLGLNGKPVTITAVLKTPAWECQCDQVESVLFKSCPKAAVSSSTACGLSWVLPCSGYGGPGAGSQPEPQIRGFGGRCHIILVGGDIVSDTWLFFGEKNSLFSFHLWKSCLCFIFSTPQGSFHIRNTLLLLQISLWS